MIAAAPLLVSIASIVPVFRDHIIVAASGNVIPFPRHRGVA